MTNDGKLVRALRRAFNMVSEDAEATARVVESAFRGEEEVNDEDLDRELRSLFYTLEREELVSIRRTEYTFEGQPRRAFFWHLKPLKELPSDDTDKGLSREERDALKVYKALPSDLWNRH
jgi:ABC-type nitrate/sulfonate/bicarbonate transport system substrate-binding protein